MRRTPLPSISKLLMKRSDSVSMSRTPLPTTSELSMNRFDSVSMSRTRWSSVTSTFDHVYTSSAGVSAGNPYPINVV